MVDTAASTTAAPTAQTGTTETAVAGTAGGVAEIVKPRPPPLWTGQKFDRWKAEVRSWRDMVEEMRKKSFWI